MVIGDEVDVLRIQGKDFECEVLEKILLQHQKHGNQLPLIVEISYNYIFPPPIKFIIQTPSHLFNSLKAHYMYGCSIEYLRQDVFESAGYELVELTMEHTAIFLRRSIAKAKHPDIFGFSKPDKIVSPSVSKFSTRKIHKI